jgi:hypothetical protein
MEKALTLNIMLRDLDSLLTVYESTFGVDEISDTFKNSLLA